MIWISLVAVAGIVLLHTVGMVPTDGVGGSMVIGLALLAAAPVVGIHEAWTRGRGPVGWLVNIAVALFGAFLVAPLGGLIVSLLLGPFTRGSSLAAGGGPAMPLALALMMLVVLGGAWGAIQVVNRWR